MIHYTSHTNNAQTVVIQLNTAVTVINGNGQNFLKSGGGSNTLTFTRSNFMNGQDNGSFNFVVPPVDASFKADGLTATVVSVYDDYSA